MGFSGWIKPPPYNLVKACMRFWCNILGVTRPLCPQIFGAIGSGVPSWRCLVYVGQAPWEWDFQVGSSPPPYNRAVGMHALLVQHSRCYQTPLSTNFWSDRVRRSELALPSVRRSGAWRFLSSRPTKVLLNNHFVHMHFIIFF